MKLSHFSLPIIVAMFLLSGCQQNREIDINALPAKILQETQMTLQTDTRESVAGVSAHTGTDAPTNTQADAPTIPHSGPLTHGSRDRKIVALTFDADMTPKMLKDLRSGKVKSLYDQRITDTLEKNSVPATLFLTGMWAQTYPEVTKKLSQNPLYEIGNHSYDHSAFSMPCYGLSAATDKKMEIVETQKILLSLTGAEPKFFRFPGGCGNDSDVRLVENYGVQIVGWDVISGDSFLKDPQKIIDKVLRKTTNGSIIVMHLDGGPTSPATALALPNIIAGLKKKGFSFVTVSGLGER